MCCGCFKYAFIWLSYYLQPGVTGKGWAGQARGLRVRFLCGLVSSDLCRGNRC